MIAVVAGNHQEFEDWIGENFVYIGDKYMIEAIDPSDIDSFAFVGNFRDHPIYFSDELLTLQMKVAAKKVGLEIDIQDPPKRKRWWQR